MINTVGDLMALMMVLPIILMIVYIVIKFIINKDFRKKLIIHILSDNKKETKK